jgi:hypothetical protein
MEVTNDIRKIAKEFLERYKTALSDAGKTASGQLEKTARCKVNAGNTYLEIIFSLESYWKYIENGTRPHFPPMEEIERWITVKKIIPRTNGGKQIPSTHQLAYLISREISKNGTKPTKLLQKTIDSSEDLIESLIDIVVKQMEGEINKDIDKTMKK